VGAAVFVVLILVVEWGTRAGWISALTLPRPSAVLETFGELHDSGLLWAHLAPSLSRLAVGNGLGRLEEAVGEGALPMVDMGDDREVPDVGEFVWHGWHAAFLGSVSECGGMVDAGWARASRGRVLGGMLMLGWGDPDWRA